MTRKMKISFLIVVWSIVAIQIYINYQQKVKNERQAVTAFSMIQNDILEETVEGYGYLGAMELDEATKKKMLCNLADKLELENDSDIIMQKEAACTKMILDCSGKDVETKIQLISMDAEQGKMEQYITMCARLHAMPLASIDFYKKMQQTYKEIGVDASVNMELVIEQSGNQIVNDNTKMKAYLSNLNAKMVDTFCDNQICTIYGYMEEEPSYFLQNGKKVNVQIVMRYDETANKTYTKIGVPLVNSSY